MKFLLKKILKILLLSLIVIIVIYFNMKTLECQQTFTITTEMIPQVKKNLVKYLCKIVDNIDFQKKHCPGPIYNILCYNNTYYIKYFVYNLDLNEIIENNNIKTQKEFLHYILELFEKNLVECKQIFLDFSILICYSLFIYYFADIFEITDLVSNFSFNFHDILQEGSAINPKKLKFVLISFFLSKTAIEYPEIFSIISMTYFQINPPFILPDYTLNHAIIQKNTMNVILYFFKNNYKFWNNE